MVLNIGLGEALTNGRAMEAAAQDLTTISGQKPIITRARKSIAGFKIRQGNAIGAAVTLRGDRMYHFLDRLVNTALPRIRDFRGMPRRGMDGRGNFSLGIREQIIFPEIDYNSIDRIRGLQVTIATSARNDAEAMRLLELYGFPLHSRNLTEALRGEVFPDPEMAQKAKVSGAGLQSLRTLWASEGIHTARGSVPHLLPGIGADRRAAGCSQSQPVVLVFHTSNPRIQIRKTHLQK